MQMSWGAPALAKVYHDVHHYLSVYHSDKNDTKPPRGLGKCIEFMEAAALFEREAAVAEDRELWRAAWVLPFSEQSHGC
jgi:hypothetical protein